MPDIAREELDENARPLSGSAASASARADLYAFLAQVFLAEMSRDLLRRIKASPLREELAAVGVTLGSELVDGDEGRVLEDLAVEYTRLFAGPGKHVPPYESVHAPGGSGRLWGPETSAVEHYIKAAGFEYRATFRGLPDHIGIEMEFMATLGALEAAALEKGDIAQARNSVRYQHEFLARHLGAWAPIFCRKVAEQAALPFYRQMAELTGEFIRAETAETTGRLA